MPTKNNIKTDKNIINHLEKGYYVSFSSINPRQFGNKSSTINQKKVYSGIIEEFDKGSVVIRSHGPRLPIEPSLDYRRKEGTVTFLSKKHQYLRCRDPPRKPWYGSIGSGHILQFDSNGKPAGYKQEENSTATQQLWWNANQSEEYLLLVLIYCYQKITRPVTE